MQNDSIDLNVAVFTTKNVIENKMTITRISHDKDGAWQFFDELSTNSNANAMIVLLGEILKIEPAILSVLTKIDEGFYAIRYDKNDDWEIRSQEMEGEEEDAKELNPTHDPLLKLKIITGVITLLYCFFPVLQYNIGTDLSNQFNDYYIFFLSSGVFAFMSFVTDFGQAFFALFILWLILWASSYFLIKDIKS
jgi:hypothetical protein